jgi:hypothetical protein
MRDILEVIKNVESIYSSNTALNTLKDFERVLSEMNMYVYKNWLDGELASGPILERHWVKASFMWPQDKMPDPMAAKRLLEYGCQVKYEKSNLLEPRKIKGPDDFRPGTRKGKLDETPIWIVEISMPRKLVEDTYNGYMTKMRESYGLDAGDKAEAAPASVSDQGAAMAPGAMPAMPAAGAAPASPMGGAPSAAPTA